MSFYTGSGSTLAINVPRQGWGDKVDTGYQAVNFTSESINVSVEKADEGSLLASKTATTRDLMSVSVGGSVSFILRPEFADKVFEAALGKKDGNTYTLCGVNEDLPIFDLYIDRKAAKKIYNSVSVSSLSLDCAAGDYVKGSFDVKGFKEEDGTGVSGITGLTVPSYRCTSAKLTLGGQTFDVSNTSISIDNALEDAPKTYSSGLYANKPQHGQRTVDVNFSIPYSSETDSLRATYLMTEANAAIHLEFTCNEATHPGHKIEIDLPNVSITEVSNSVGGTGLIEATIAGTALSVGTAEPITVVITRPAA